jgi:hypothetical protein
MGNKFGWVLAGIFVVGIAAIVTMKFVFPQPEQPTSETRPAVLAFQEPTADISPVVSLPTGSGNAADAYIKALDFYEENESSFNALRRRADAAPSYDLTGSELALAEKLITLVEPGTKCKTMEMTFVHTPKELKVSGFADKAEDLDRLSVIMDYLFAHYYTAKQLDKARRIANMQFILGWQMMNERARVYMTQIGMEIQLAALNRLERLAEEQDQTSKAEAIYAYQSQLNLINNTFNIKNRLLRNVDPPAGDVFNIIEKDQDRAWRTEAILTLGILKFSSKSHKGNMRVLNDYLDQYSQSDEPLYRAAAKVARECTKMQIETWAMGRSD